MDKPISVGDMVMGVKSCCPMFWDGDGSVFVVAKLQFVRTMRCSYCDSTIPGGPCAAASQDNDLGGAPLSWLKRIDPLDELEGEKREEEIAA